MKLVVNLLAVLVLVTFISANESPGFFLKATKNVPRLGRRAAANDMNNFFLKSSKNVPRIGRRNSDAIPADPSPWQSIPSPSKRLLGSAKDNHLSGQYRNIQPYDSNSLFELMGNEEFRNGAIKFISWKDFDAALESDFDLYVKLYDLAQDEGIPKAFTNKLRFVPLGDGDNVRTNSYYYNSDGLSSLMSGGEKLDYQM